MSEDAMVRISAVICTLNRAAYLAKAMESLINQTYPKEYYEIIVVDNGSTDNTREVVEQFSQFARIRYIYEPIKGLCQARNTGWQAAGGKYVAYLDDDAIACPRWLEKMMESFETIKPAPASVGGRVIPIWESERPAWLEEQMLGVYAIVDWGNHARFLKPSSPERHVGCNVAYSRKVLEECGGFNINLGRKGKNLLSNDEHLIRKYMDSHGLGIYYDPEILIDHLVPKERVTRRFMLRRHFWQGISDVVEWYEESPSPPGRLWCFMSGLEGLASSGLYLMWFLLQFFLRRPWVVLRDLAKIEPARDCFFRGFDNLWRLVGQSRGYLQISMSPRAKGTRKGIALEQGINSPSRTPPKNWAWHTVRPYLLAYLKTNHPLMISVGRFAKRIMRTPKNILSGGNGMMFNTIMKLTLMTTLLAVLTPARSPRRINPERRNNTILIIGNGSSTRYLAHLGFDKIPKDVDTFGMGAAYRYYSHIGWWPTYYALCDVKVVFYHQKDLKAIVEDPDIPVRKYFLPLRVSDNEKLEIIPHSSTGDFCVRKAIELGYKRIFIIGIETDYIEQIRESSQLTPEEIEQIGLGQLEEFKNLPAGGRSILMVTKTPLVNTNYFFDSYQREGDIYSLPQGDTHYRSWQRLARLAEKSKVKIINLSPTSPLMVFPKASLDSFLNANTYHAFLAPKPPNNAGNSSRKAADEPGRVPLPAAKNTTSATGKLLFQRLIGYLKKNYPMIITLGRFAKWILATLKNTFSGIGCIALLLIGGLYVAGALIEPLRWYLVGIASALLLLGGGLLALSYARFTLNRITSDQRTQVSYINKQISDINKQVSYINKQISDINKEVAPYNKADHLRLERAVSIEKQVEMAELQYDLRDSKPILFFNATSGPGTLSFASTAGLIISWALRLSGHRVFHLVCRKGLRRCIQGTNRHEPNQPMPCETCYAIKSKIFPQDLRLYLEPKSEVPSALLPLGSYSVDELADFVYQGINIGDLCISSARWTLRRHRLDSNPRSTRLLREYIRGGMSIVDTLQRLFQKQELHSMVVFNGVFYPEAIAREVALQKGLPVVAYEVSIPDLKVFLSHGVAAGGGLITIPEDFQMSANQEADFARYMSQRIRGTVGQAGLWPEMKGIEPDLQTLAGQYKNVVSVFTNVLFDTSQYGANTVFESMFDWLDEIMKLASLHPETLFVVRAHPAEVLPRHESEELVGDWLKEKSYLAIPNVRFIPPTDYISSYDLLNISRFCLVYNSTIGLEAVVLGIPTVTAAAGRYSGAGVTHAPASRKAYRKLVETFLKNGPPPVEDTVRQRARHSMYQLFFRQGLDLSAFLESPDWTLKPIVASALHPDNSPEMNIIYKGIMEGGPFYYPH